jgi:hypothetical protein
MLADVEIGTKLAFTVSHNQDAFASHVAHHSVADVWQLVGSPYVTPVFAENGFEF